MEQPVARRMRLHGHCILLPKPPRLATPNFRAYKFRLVPGPPGGPREVKERARDVSPYRRNVLVGVTVLAALGILGWMMIQFGGSVAKPFAPRHVPIHLRALRADGLAEGSGVFFKGVQVGQVLRVYRVAEDPLWVHIDAEVE